MAGQTVRYFDKLGPSWAQKYAKGKPMASRPLRFVSAIQTRVAPGGRLLDFGCGTGDIAYACYRAGYEVRGADQSLQMVVSAIERFGEAGITFDLLRCTNAAPRLPYPAEEFGGILASSVLEYVEDVTECLAELRRVCQAGGWLFLTVPNPWHPIRWFESIAKGALSVGREHLPDRVKGYLEYLTVSTNRFFLRRWKRLLRSSGWECREVRGRAHPLALLIARAV